MSIVSYFLLLVTVLLLLVFFLRLPNLNSCALPCQAPPPTKKGKVLPLPPEDRSRIFERFFTSDRAHTAGKGTGLGLPICHRILAMHGERIWLADTEEGAAFCFTLPMEPTEKKVQP